MDIETLRQYCLSKKAVTEDMPFGDTTLVFRILGKEGKIFALLSLDEVECRINLKCNPEYAVELREQYPDSIIPGYHMNKTHWNTVYCERGLDDSFIRTLVDHSYEVIVASFKKNQRALLEDF
jgi:predicted DNA-binding protein (MmcQ/YjbR family)